MKVALLSTFIASVSAMLDSVVVEIGAIAAGIGSAIYIGKQIHETVGMAYRAFRATYEGVTVLDDIPPFMERVDKRLDDGQHHMARIDVQLEEIRAHVGLPAQVDVTLRVAAPASGSE